MKKKEDNKKDNSSKKNGVGNLNKKGKKLGGVMKTAIKILKGKEGGKKYMKSAKK